MLSNGRPGSVSSRKFFSSPEPKSAASGYPDPTKVCQDI